MRKTRDRIDTLLSDTRHIFMAQVEDWKDVEELAGCEEEHKQLWHFVDIKRERRTTYMVMCVKGHDNERCLEM